MFISNYKSIPLGNNEQSLAFRFITATKWRRTKKLMLKQIKVLSLIQILKKQKRTFYQWRSHVERELVLQASGLYLQPAEFTVRAAPARCRGHYWCVYPWNGSGLVVEVNSITPGLCSVNMAQSEADAVGDYLALRWERHAPLIRAGRAAEKLNSSLWPASSFMEEQAWLGYYVGLQVALELVKQAFVIAMLTLIVAVMVFLAVDESDSSVEVMVVTLACLLMKCQSYYSHQRGYVIGSVCLFKAGLQKIREAMDLNQSY